MATTTAQCPSCKGVSPVTDFYARNCCLDMPRVSVCVGCTDKCYYCLYCFGVVQKVREYFPVPSGFEGISEYGIDTFYGAFSGLSNTNWNAVTPPGWNVSFVAFKSCLSGYAKNIRMMRDEHLGLQERNRQLTVLTTSLTNRYYTVVNQGASVLTSLEQCLEENKTLRVENERFHDRLTAFEGREASSAEFRRQCFAQINDRLAALEEAQDKSVVTAALGAHVALDDRLSSLEGGEEILCAQWSAFTDQIAELKSGLESVRELLCSKSSLKKRKRVRKAVNARKLRRKLHDLSIE